MINPEAKLREQLPDFPDPGRPHMPRSNSGHPPPLPSLCSGARKSKLRRPHAITTEAGTPKPVLHRGSHHHEEPCTTARAAPLSTSREKPEQREGPAQTKSINQVIHRKNSTTTKRIVSGNKFNQRGQDLHSRKKTMKHC